VIDDQDNQLGILPTSEAQKLAEEKGLDLVEVSPNADPPVARVMDFGKFQYEQAKQKTKQKRTKGGQVKEIRLSMKIGEHDLLYRLERAKGFLAENNKVRFNVMMKGRENANPKAGIARVKHFVGLLEGVTMETEPVRQGRSVSVVVVPAKKTTKEPDIKRETNP
jgi:translation initiation factor IF-3